MEWLRSLRLTNGRSEREAVHEDDEKHIPLVPNDLWDGCLNWSTMPESRVENSSTMPKSKVLTGHIDAECDTCVLDCQIRKDIRSRRMHCPYRSIEYDGLSATVIRKMVRSLSELDY